MYRTTVEKTTTSKADHQAQLNAAIRSVGQRIKRWSAGVATAAALTLVTPPVPASRPKVSRFGTYYGKTYNKFRATAPADLEREISERGLVPFAKDVPLVVLVEVVKAKPKTGKRFFPNGDGDNYAKALLDVSNGRLWHDDDQLVVTTVSKRYAEHGEDEGTEFHITPILDMETT